MPSSTDGTGRCLNFDHVADALIPVRLRAEAVGTVRLLLGPPCYADIYVLLAKTIEPGRPIGQSPQAAPSGGSWIRPRRSAMRTASSLEPAPSAAILLPRHARTSSAGIRRATATTAEVNPVADNVRTARCCADRADGLGSSMSIERTPDGT